MNLARSGALCSLIVFALLFVAAASEAQSYPPAWKSASSYAIGDQVQLNGNVLRATHAVTPGGFKYDEWELWEVRANTNVMVGVGQTFPKLETAWPYVKNARVAEGAYLHLYLSSVHGVLNDSLSGPFSLDHQSGARVSIIGDNASNIVLGGPSGLRGDGLTIDSGHAFGTISTISILGNSLFGGGNAIAATGNSSIANVTGVVISYFNAGVYAAQGSSISVDSSVAINYALAFEIEATSNGNVSVASGWAGTSGNSATLYASYGGQISAEDCSISNSGSVGVYANYGGVIDVSSSSISGCYVGISSYDRGFIYAEFCTFNGNSGYDVSAQNGGAIEVDNNALNAHIDSGAGSNIY